MVSAHFRSPLCNECFVGHFNGVFIVLGASQTYIPERLGKFCFYPTLKALTWWEEILLVSLRILFFVKNVVFYKSWNPHFRFRFWFKIRYNLFDGNCSIPKPPMQRMLSAWFCWRFHSLGCFPNVYSRKVRKILFLSNSQGLNVARRNSACLTKDSVFCKKCCFLQVLKSTFQV